MLINSIVIHRKQNKNKTLQNVHIHNSFHSSALGIISLIPINRCPSMPLRKKQNQSHLQPTTREERKKNYAQHIN